MHILFIYIRRHIVAVGHSSFLQGYCDGDLGLKTTLIAIPFFHSIYFPIYGSAKKYFRTKYNFSRHKTAIGAAFVAGILSDLISNPLWVLRVISRSQELE